MIIGEKHTAALLDSIERVNKLNSDRLDDAAVYEDLAGLSREIDRVTKALREAITGFYDELRSLGRKPPEIPMEDPPGLEVDVSGPDVRVEIDGILPFPITGSVYYLHEKLDTALARFREETPVPRPLFTERCAVVFIHHYLREGKAAREIRDYDNMERRCILNVLARHFTRDDSPGCLVTMDVIAPGERNFTEIRIMTIPRFREFAMSENIGYSPPGILSKKIPRIYQKSPEI